MEQDNTLFHEEFKELVDSHYDDIENIIHEFYAELKKDFQDGDENNV